MELLYLTRGRFLCIIFQDFQDCLCIYSDSESHLFVVQRLS